jgi:EmrB/QacA subfamily drug resistance transporter
MCRTGDTRSTGDGRRVRIAIAGLMAAMLLAALDQTIVATALWTIARDLDPAHGITRLSWVVTAYILAATATTPLYGRISDIYGRRPLYVFAIGVFLAGSALAGAATDMTVLIGGRAAQGVGAGGVIGLTFAVVADLVPGRERGRYQGYFGAVFAVASIAGPLLGGLITRQPPWPPGFASWRWVFIVNLPIGLLAAGAAAAGMRGTETPRRTGARVDVLGATLLVSGVCTLLLVVEGGIQQHARDPARTAALGVGGLALLAAFMAWEYRTERAGLASGGPRTVPLLPLRLLTNPVVRLAVPVAFVVGSATFGAVVYISLHLQIVDGFDPVGTGVHLVPMMLGVLAGSTTAGRVISRIGRYDVFPVIGTALATAGLGLLGLLRVHTSPAALSAFTFLLGLGLGLVTQVLVMTVQNAVGKDHLGAVTGAVTFFRQLGGSFGTALFGAILAARLAARLPGDGTAAADPARLRGMPAPAARATIGAFVDATNAVFLAAAALMAVACLVSLRLLARLRGTTAGATVHAGRHRA